LAQKKSSLQRLLEKGDDQAGPNNQEESAVKNGKAARAASTK
jgi:hypothetical protein